MLRKYNQPITLFGETDEDRYLRFKNISDGVLNDNIKP